MDSNSHEKTPTFDLPLPQGELRQPAEQSPMLSASGEKAASQAVELGVPSTPGPGPKVHRIADSQQPYPTSTADPAAVSAANDTSSLGPMPQIADDTDLIEKEWVDKAKQIVEQTAQDPYLQNKEINKVKMDYLKKRYNKQVKLNED